MPSSCGIAQKGVGASFVTARIAAKIMPNRRGKGARGRGAMALSTFGHFKARRPSIPEMGDQSTGGFMRRCKPYTQPSLCGVPKSCKYVGEQLPVRRAFHMKRATRLMYGLRWLAALGHFLPAFHQLFSIFCQLHIQCSSLIQIGRASCRERV